MERTIESGLSGRENNFDLIRLFAAWLVLFSHSFDLLNRAGEDPTGLIFGGQARGGGLGVAIFFVISGFLVTRSVVTRSISQYLCSRALRIVPALAVVSAISVFVIGPLYSSLPPQDYFARTETWSYLLNTIIWPIRYTLPGVFTELPSASINGSLWTLQIECLFYLLLPVLAAVGLIKKWPMLSMFILVLGGFLIAVNVFGLKWTNQGPWLFIGCSTYSTLGNGAFFLAGSVMWLYRDKLVLDFRLAALGLILLTLVTYDPLRIALFRLVLPYCVIVVALSKPVLQDEMRKIGDLSYGFYIFAWPVQKILIVQFAGWISPYTLIALATPLTLVCAWASWHLVEKPFLALRDKRPPKVSTTRVPQFPHHAPSASIT
ncbi:acyltransferase [Hyphomicrobium sp. 99]|uniref:acyltransferase family protein n=1 Tax=Hyphomicrobium sp. 99 TaxID=1163419 RepID=UPI0005F85156|nr:acyltransferase [Hyphomicrobium sp. 99]